VTVTATSFANGGRVDDWHHLGDVLLQQPVKEGLITILQSGEKDISFEVVRFTLVVSVYASQLFIDRRRVIRKQSQQTKPATIFLSKGTPLVKQRIIEQAVPGQAGSVDSRA
jgi:hypothetical protein